MKPPGPAVQFDNGPPPNEHSNGFETFCSVTVGLILIAVASAIGLIIACLVSFIKT